MAVISEEGFRNIVNQTTGNWPSGALKSESKNPNFYTNQQKTSNGYTPKDPTTDTSFYDNYRSTTRTLGQIARAYKTRGKNLPNVDSETQKIMDRIKLPDYNDVITDEMSKDYMEDHNEQPILAEQAFNKDANDFAEDNFYYKLRAAQVLKSQPEQVREGLLNNFNISAYDAKNELDKLIDSENKKLASDISSGTKAIGNIVNGLSSSFVNRLRELNGSRATTTDENGVKTTTTVTSGPANLDELAERLGGNNSFRLYSKSDYNDEGELTDEAKSRGPSAWNSNTTNQDGTAKSETVEDNSDVVEYTYKPGDTFGQVLLNLGLNTDAGLWGANGDVAYYTKQLVEQGALDQRGNVKVGTTIKLRRRK